METDLTDVEPEILNASLLRFYTEHSQAIDTGDKQTAAETHWAIQAIQNEFARRTREWIAAKQAN